ncbi:hypothetical protein CRX42_07255 [Pseudomonas jessenii]|uniref:Uncharacterized protein n=1 Tax=Pseudomonas jessenii TaxID=77298 RepID=A0A2W0ETH8_PSEJE|nr:hypothetical protein [Pseudomonas jessenii]PYY71206.1 hypothetical protein CRX42_07255 [Pseudomonas jessenii]
MSHQRLIDLAKAYAENRTQLYSNAKAIRDCNEDGYIDMQPLRERFYHGEWLEEEAVLRWNGWLYAVQALHDFDGKELDEDHAYYCMAVLLDERKAIKQRANTLKSRLRIIGAQLLKSSP